MRKLVLIAVLGILAVGAGALAVVYRETRPSNPAAPSPVVDMRSSDPGALPGPRPSGEPLPTGAVALPAPPPEAPPRGHAIPAGDLQPRLESSDPDERKDALVEARSQRRDGMVDWLNRNTRRRAQAAGAEPRK